MVIILIKMVFPFAAVVSSVLYQTQETEFHRDIQTLRTESNTMCSRVFLMKFEVFG